MFSVFFPGLLTLFSPFNSLFTIFNVSLLASYSVSYISGLLKTSCGKSCHKRQSRDNATFSSLPTTCAACTTAAADASSPPGFPPLLGVGCIVMVYNHDITCTVMNALNPAQPLRDGEMDLAERFSAEVRL